MRKQWYVGHNSQGLKAFKATETPIAEHYPQFFAVIGPFKTKRAAFWAEKYGFNNPHFQTTYDAERLSKLEQMTNENN